MVHRNLGRVFFRQLLPQDSPREVSDGLVKAGAQVCEYPCRIELLLRTLISLAEMVSRQLHSPHPVVERIDVGVESRETVAMGPR